MRYEAAVLIAALTAKMIEKKERLKKKTKFTTKENCKSAVEETKNFLRTC